MISAGLYPIWLVRNHFQIARAKLMFAYLKQNKDMYTEVYVIVVKV